MSQPAVLVSPSAPNQPVWSSAPPNTDAGPASLVEGESSRALATFVNKEDSATGVFFIGSRVAINAIPDGLTRTILLGEKYLDPAWYTNGLCPADNEAALVGCNGDITRWTDLPPLNDTRGTAGRNHFGGPHLGLMGIAYCDSSTRFTDITISLAVFKSLGNRRDGGPAGEVP